MQSVFLCQPSVVWGARRLRRSRGSSGQGTLRRTRLVIGVLLLGSMAVVLFLAWFYHLGVPGVVVSVVIGVPGLYIGWVPLRDSLRKPADMSLKDRADKLADGVADQWQKEVAVRRLYDPYPLPVCWSAANPDFTDDWSMLETLAASGAAWSAPPPEKWASGPDELAGSGDDLASVLARIPTRRLVVLGQPGSGKTMLMLRLVLAVLRARKHGDAVPFLVPLASWNPVERDLREWLADQLVLAHTALADTEPGGKGSTIAQALLASGLIFPVLDGLDEIPRSARGMAISRLNEALMPGQPIVVTCRTEDYRDAVRPPDGEEVSLRAAAAIQLAPLSVDVVAKYLLSDAGGPNARARWRPVIEAMEKAMPVAQALTTPLMAGLARVIYNPRPGEKLGDLDDPAELCKPVLGDRTAVEAHLFDGFIPAAYRGESPWTAEQAEPWLMFLAHHLQDTVDGTDLAWWQLIEGKQSEHHSRPARSLRFRPILVVNSVLLGAMTGVLTYATAHLLPTGYGAGYQAAYLVAGNAMDFSLISVRGQLSGRALSCGLVVAERYGYGCGPGVAPAGGRFHVRRSRCTE